MIDPKYRRGGLAPGAPRNENAGTPRIRRSLCLLRQRSTSPRITLAGVRQGGS
jgi:hypothetical protein